jgi:hypothetical protein
MPKRSGTQPLRRSVACRANRKRNVSRDSYTSEQIVREIAWLKVYRCSGLWALWAEPRKIKNATGLRWEVEKRLCRVILVVDSTATRRPPLACALRPSLHEPAGPRILT